MRYYLKLLIVGIFLNSIICCNTCEIETGAYIEETDLKIKRDYIRVIQIDNSKYEIEVNGDYRKIVECKSNELAFGLNKKYVVFMGKKFAPISNEELSDINYREYINK